MGTRALPNTKPKAEELNSFNVKFNKAVSKSLNEIVKDIL